jgi:putative ABC transport system ATP-binding protein
MNVSLLTDSSGSPETALTTVNPRADIVPPVVEAIGLTKVYGQGEAAVRALDGIDLSLGRGRLTAIMGPSGSGKSTALHCLAGLDSPTAGDIILEGQSLAQMNQRRLTLLRRKRIGFIFQAFNLVPTLTAWENITLPLDIAQRPLDRAYLEHLIAVLDLQDRLKHRPAQLSGGQQQRVACARALASRPAVVFADEPTGNLDSVSSRQVLAFLRQSVQELGQTIIMVTHDPVAASSADRVVFLADGHLVGDLEQPTAPDILNFLTALSPDREGRA